MAMPPTDLPADELVLRLAEAPFTSEVVDFPRRGADGNPIGRLRLKVLSARDVQTCKHAAQRSVGKRFLDLKEVAGYLGLQDSTGSETSCEVLAKSCLSVEPGPDGKHRQIWRSGDAVAEALTSAEIAHLFALWVQAQNRFAGDERTLTEAEVTAWVERLKDGLALLPFLGIDSQLRDRLLCLLAERLSTVSLLVSSQPEELPTRLASLLETWSTATTCCSEQRASGSASELDAIKSALTYEA
jgi:hypothetical protein